MPLLEAIHDGAAKTVSEILGNMEQRKVAEVLTTCDFQTLNRDVADASCTTTKGGNRSPRKSLIVHACLAGNVDVFDTILRAMEAKLTDERVGSEGIYCCVSLCSNSDDTRLEPAPQTRER